MDATALANSGTSIITLSKIIELQIKKEMPSIDDISLKVLQDFYELNIAPYEYVYKCLNDLEIRFTIKKHEFCHLIFGTIDKNIAKHERFKGEPGYNNIKNGIVTMDNLPAPVKKYAKFRLKSFIFLPLILDNPQAIYFNPKIVPKGDNKYTCTGIDANFLLFKQIKNIGVHFFLKNISEKSNTLSAYSFFHKDDDTYIKDQIILNIIKIEINSLIKAVK